MIWSTLLYVKKTVFTHLFNNYFFNYIKGSLKVDGNEK
jgi:hypothetical protein